MRLDYTGGVEGENFFLSMGGFNDYMTHGTHFKRTVNTTKALDIDFKNSWRVLCFVTLISVIRVTCITVCEHTH